MRGPKGQLSLDSTNASNDVGHLFGVLRFPVKPVARLGEAKSAERVGLRGLRDVTGFKRGLIDLRVSCEKGVERCDACLKSAEISRERP